MSSRTHSSLDSSLHRMRALRSQVALLGHYNGQSLGSPIQDFVSRQLVVDSVREVRGEEEVAGSQRGVQDKPCTNDGRSEFSDAEAGYISEPNRGVEVLVRTTPGTEYIKASISFIPLLLVFCHHWCVLFAGHVMCARAMCVAISNLLRTSWTLLVMRQVLSLVLASISALRIGVMIGRSLSRRDESEEPCLSEIPVWKKPLRISF